MWSHLEEKIIDNYRSSARKCFVLRKNSENYDNTPQIKPTLWWVKGLALKIQNKVSWMATWMEYREKKYSRIRKLACSK